MRRAVSGWDLSPELVLYTACSDHGPRPLHPASQTSSPPAFLSVRNLRKKRSLLAWSTREPTIIGVSL